MQSGSISFKTSVLFSYLNAMMWCQSNRKHLNSLLCSHLGNLLELTTLKAKQEKETLDRKGFNVNIRCRSSAAIIIRDWSIVIVWSDLRNQTNRECLKAKKSQFWIQVVRFERTLKDESTPKINYMINTAQAKSTQSIFWRLDVWSLLI